MAPILHRRIPAPAPEPHSLLSAISDLHHSSQPPSLSLRFAPALQPTRTLPHSLTKVLPRQQAHTTSTIPGVYGSTPNGPDVGTVVGITLGSVAGFLLLLWLIYTCLNAGNPNGDALAESEVVSVGTASMVAGKRERDRKSVV